MLLILAWWLGLYRQYYDVEHDVEEEINEDSLALDQDAHNGQKTQFNVLEGTREELFNENDTGEKLLENKKSFSHKICKKKGEKICADNYKELKVENYFDFHDIENKFLEDLPDMLNDSGKDEFDFINNDCVSGKEYPSYHSDDFFEIEDEMSEIKQAKLLHQSSFKPLQGKEGLLKTDELDYDNDEFSLEDNEVEAVFKNLHLCEEEPHNGMSYLTSNSTTAVTMTRERLAPGTVTKKEKIGRIHSIVVKDETDKSLSQVTVTIKQAKTLPRILSPKTITLENSKPKINSTRIRARSPRIHIDSNGPSVLSMHQEDNNFMEADAVRLVVSTQDQPDLQSHNKIPLGTFDDAYKEFSTSTIKQQKKNNSRQSKELQKVEQKLTDFDAIMNKRKKQVDTINDTATLLGQLSNRDAKIYGKKPLSRRWKVIKNAVRKKQYLAIQGKKM